MTIITAITDVWTTIMEELVGMLNSAQDVFFNSTSGLTFLGTLSVITVAVGVVFLIIGVIQNFLHLRG